MALGIGFGLDIHALVPGDGVVLGGVRIPASVGTEAHSDGDVLLHAIIDALLSAAGCGDIGARFPDTSEEFRGISSMALLERTIGIVREAGFAPIQIDSTLVLDEPRIAPSRDEMIRSISGILGPGVIVGIKGKTTEGTRPVPSIEAYAVVIGEKD